MWECENILATLQSHKYGIANRCTQHYLYKKIKLYILLVSSKLKNEIDQFLKKSVKKANNVLISFLASDKIRLSEILGRIDEDTDSPLFQFELHFSKDLEEDWDQILSTIRNLKGVEGLYQKPMDELP